MRHRDDLPTFIVSLGDFQKFDHGETIEEMIPDEWDDLLPGDLFSWECAQFSGRAEIVLCRDKSFAFRKLS